MLAHALASVTDALEESKRSAADRDASTGPSPSDGECCWGEKFALYIEVEKNQGLTWVLADKAVPCYAWTKDMMRDHLDWDIKDISDIAMLSSIACLIFRGQHMAKEGFTAEDV